MPSAVLNRAAFGRGRTGVGGGLLPVVRKYDAAQDRGLATSRGATSGLLGNADYSAGLAQGFFQQASQLAPAYAELLKATKPNRAAVNTAAVDTGAAFDESLGAVRRDLGRAGVNPNSGRYAGLLSRWGLQRAAAESGAMSRAARAEDEQRFGRLQSVANAANSQATIGAGLLGQTSGALSTAGQAARVESDMFGQKAGEAAQFQAELDDLFPAAAEPSKRPARAGLMATVRSSGTFGSGTGMKKGGA